MPTTLADGLRADCEECAAALPPGPARSAVAAVAARLAEPTLRVAVGGRVKAGKSTLVNALLGQRLAPTHRTECTLVPASFAFGYANQVLVHRYDGRTETVAGRPGGGIPDRLPCPPDEVERLTVLAPNRRLDAEYVFVDTPGRDALSGLDTKALAAVTDADALLLVMPKPGKDEKDALEEYVSVVAGTHLSAANVVGVLSRIDELGDGGFEDARAEARRVARRAMRHLGPMISEIVPVAGLVAQTARGADFTEHHMRALLRIAAADPRPARLLYAPAFFLDQASPDVPPAMRQELFELLGMPGLRVAVAAVDGGVAETDRLLGILADVSGIQGLLDVIRTRLLDRADILRTNSALARLAALPDSTGDDPALRALAAKVRARRRHPDLRARELADVARAVHQGVLPLDEAEEAELHLLLSGGTYAARLGLPADAGPREIAERARAGALRWRTLESDLPRRARPHVVLVRELYEQIHFACGTP